MALQATLTTYNLLVAALLSGVVLVGAGFVAAVMTVVMKWLCVQRIAAGDHVLWSKFVWLNELQDQFVETVAGRGSWRTRWVRAA